MSKFIKVSVKQVAASNNSATYECTVSRDNSSYFGYCNRNTHLVIWKAGSNGKGKAYKHWGFPTRANWKDSWGEPSWYLWGGNETNIGYGNLDGFLQNSYKWQEVVNIDRGNKRQGSKQIKVGVKTGPNTSSDFASDVLKTITLKTTKIADASNVSLDILEMQDPENGNRILTVTWDCTNPENYYTMTLYRNGVKVSTPANLYIENITPEIFNKTIVFEIRIHGKDGTYYKELTKTKSITIEPSGPGLYIKDNDSVCAVNRMFLNNVTHKEIMEVWIKKDGKVYKTVK